jgi:hypothetical protein
MTEKLTELAGTVDRRLLINNSVAQGVTARGLPAPFRQQR